jgi:hypothetical protein
MTSDLENDNVMRTKRASRWRSVLFQRSTWAVSPVSRAHGCMLLFRNDRSIDFQEVGEAMTEAKLLRNRLPQPLACLFAPIPNGVCYHLPCLTAQSNGQTEGQVQRLKLLKRQMYGRGRFDLLRKRVLKRA